ncbi:type II toxin-antitoxin system TacA family antitoxin [Candidatus Thiosymbion oneisti]|uniref:type II toxin-antitoxin system TacA family antitoxin n=1 Tax=Candidatus Thiosymbion oneisti TaxID=589554 RepID=UPI000B7FF954|nr:DUF1778 domain-containing protein [Candidatus Thiosymbion oneisti]
MSKNARLEARLTPDIHALLKRAAAIQGRSLSDFVVSAARHAAVETIEQADMIRLSQADQERFAAALCESSPLTPAMERAIRHHEELVGPLVE